MFSLMWVEKDSAIKSGVICNAGALIFGEITLILFYSIHKSIAVNP